MPSPHRAAPKPSLPASARATSGVSLDGAADPQVEELAIVSGGRVFLSLSLAGQRLPELPIRLLTADGRVAGAEIAKPAEEPEREGGRVRYWARVAVKEMVERPGPRHLTLEIAGIPIAPPLLLPALDTALLGFVEQANAEEIRGWAIGTRDAAPVSIDLVSDGAIVRTIRADQPRPDLAKHGLPRLDCGFAIRTHSLPLSQGGALSLVFAGSAVNLGNSPLLFSASDRIRGLFDGIEGNQACGWVLDVTQPDRPCIVEAVTEGRVVGRATATVMRRDVLEAGHPTDRCGFRITFTEPLQSLLGKDISVRVAGLNMLLPGGPHQPSLNRNIEAYLAPDRGIPAATLDRLRRRIAHRTEGCGVSIVMPVYNTKRDWLVEALRSVCTQWCGRWELICIDDASTEPQVAMVLNWFAQTEPRIRVIRAPRNLGIAGATNLGIAAATQPLIAFMDHDDVLEPDAVYHLITAAETGAGLIYSDEAIVAEETSVVLDVRARPAFSHDYYLSHPYFVHLLAVRREIAQALRFDESLAISADVDFVLRVVEASAAVAHVPRVLYRWRTHGESAGHAKRAEVMAATTAALQRHLDRTRPGTVARPGPEFNQYEILWPDPGGRVLIVIPTKDGVEVLRQCIESIEATVPDGEYSIVVIDHESKEPRSRRYLAQLARRHAVMPYVGSFNYAEMNNLAARAHGEGADFILFMNNDVEAIEAGWLQRMRSLAARSEVGIVGALLLYSDKRVQHGGVILGTNGLADHALRFVDAWEGNGERALGYNASLTSVRDFSAVTAACMMMRRAVFTEVDGFDEGFAVGFNDTDLCLRVGRAGYKILYDGRSVLFHHESVTRIAKAALKHPKDDARLKRRWKPLLAADPWYNPALELDSRDHRLRQESCGTEGPRLVRLGARPAGTKTARRRKKG